MVDPNTRQGKRTPVTLKIKFKSETLEQFIERYAVDVSQGGIFIRTKEPLAVGTQMRFEFQLRDASPLIGGEGTVVWTRENDPSRPAIAPGMGVRFDRLAEGSQTVLERILSEKAKQAPQRNTDSPTKPPLFTDTPTRVAPMPMQEQLLNSLPKRPSLDNFGEQGTPLPKPMPFHSDAEDFDEQAFEEATKVRALDELIAQTADGGAGGASTVIPADELAARRFAATTRVDSPAAEASATPATAKPEGTTAPAVERDSAPVLPSPPASSAQPRLLDTTPSPRSVDAPAVDNGAAKTKLGFDAPRATSGATSSVSKSATKSASTPIPVPVASKTATTRPSGMQAVAAEPTEPTKIPAAQKSSAMPIVILLLLVLAAGAAGVWFFYLRPKAQEEAARQAAIANATASGSAPVLDNGSAGAVTDDGTAGSAASRATGAGSAGGAAVAFGPTIDTVITSSVAKAVVEVVGTDQTGPAPFTAKLEKDKPYKVRVTAPGFAASELDITGGAETQTAKLVAKPRIVAVTTEPTGALIFVDGKPTGRTTPSDVELTKAQAAKKTVRITVRKGGYKQSDKVIAAEAYTEEDARLVAKVDAQLAIAPVVNRPPPPDRGTGSAGASGGSDAATPTPTPDPNAGSATPPTPPATPPAGGGSATKTPPTTPTPSAAAAGSASKPAEPEPSFAK